MRVLVSPDCFTGTLSALQAGEAIRTGWLHTNPNDVVSVLPVCDGGPGFLDVAVNAFSAARVPAIVRDPLGRDIPAEFAIAGQQAWIESAQTCGLHLLSVDQRDAGVTSSFGVGQLIAAAIDAGATHITIGVGGTATNDAGAGMWAALGATAQGSSLDAGGLALRAITELDLAPALARIAGVEIVVVTDVDNPLLGARGATATYAPQKGATEELVMRLEVSLRDFAQLVGKRGDGKDAAVALGAGSGGGLGYGLIHLGAVRESGIDYVMQAVDFEQQIAESDIIITGEGCLDDQSLHGKVVAGVAAAVSAVGKPCIVLAGEVRLGKRECASSGIDAAYSMKELFGAQAALEEPAQTLQAMASRVAKTWGRA
jgi:glycerate kinase